MSVKPVTPYQLAVLAALASCESPHVAVVGANDGRINDPIYRLVAEHLSDKVLITLIEPNSSLNAMLAKNYEMVANKRIINACVGPEGRVKIHTVREEFWDRCQPTYAASWPNYRAPTGVTSTDRKFVERWVSKCGVENPHAAVTSEEVPSDTLPSLLAKAGAPSLVDVLQIDAEGADDIVLFNSAIEATKPNLIYFETEHLGEDRRKAVLQYLTEHGYLTMALGANSLAVRSITTSKV